MRVAIVTESFLPHVNGVTNSVLRVLEHLDDRGHEALVLAPGVGPVRYAGAQIVRTPSASLSPIVDLSLGLPAPGLEQRLRAWRPDVVHLASPVALAAQGARSASRLGLPTVAVYQTDLAGFARRYGLAATSPLLERWLRHVHRRADLTLAPTALVGERLRRLGVPRVRLWPRGVDGQRFSPARRDASWRARHAGAGELLVGYVGRLAREKRVDLLEALRGLEGCRLVVVGDGPARGRLERGLPEATFTGFLEGEELARAVASLDVFVHTGPHETFCQAAQEALSAGVPVVAPDAGGIAELVDDGRNGLRWAADDPAALRAAVATLLARPALRDALAARARPSVAHRSWSAVGDRLIAHYRSVAGPRVVEEEQVA